MDDFLNISLNNRSQSQGKPITSQSQSHPLHISGIYRRTKYKESGTVVGWDLERGTGLWETVEWCRISLGGDENVLELIEMKVALGNCI